MPIQQLRTSCKAEPSSVLSGSEPQGFESSRLASIPQVSRERVRQALITHSDLRLTRRGLALPAAAAAAVLMSVITPAVPSGDTNYVNRGNFPVGVPHTLQSVDPSVSILLRLRRWEMKQENEARADN